VQAKGNENLRGIFETSQFAVHATAKQLLTIGRVAANAQLSN